MALDHHLDCRKVKGTGVSRRLRWHEQAWVSKDSVPGLAHSIGQNGLAEATAFAKRVVCERLAGGGRLSAPPGTNQKQPHEAEHANEEPVELL